jgi:ATP-binding cassette subfamily B protein RaxB
MSNMFGWKKQVNSVLQTESAECGLACLAMIANYYGHNIDLTSLRSRHPISMKGATLTSLMRISTELNLGSRPVKLDLDQISGLRLPCILHWNFNHFVILQEVRASHLIIHDPSIGTRKISLQDFSSSFTGVALELWPNANFTQTVKAPAVKLLDLVGKIRGLKRAILQVAIVALAMELVAALSPLFLQWLVDEVAVSQDRNLLWTLAIGFGLLVILKQILAIMRSSLVLYFSTRFSVQWRANIFNHLIRLPVQYFEKRYLGDVISRFESVEKIQNTLTTTFVESILDGFMTLFTLAMLMLYDVKLGTTVLCATGLYSLVRWAWYRPQHLAIQDQIYRGSLTQSHFIETLRGIKTIKLFHRHEERRIFWTTLLVSQVNAEVRTNKLQIAFKVLNDLIFGLSNIIVLAFGASLVIDNQFTIGALMAFAAYKSQFDSRVTLLIDRYWDYKMLRVHCERLADIALSDPEPDSDEGIEKFSKKSALGLEVRNLSFRYSRQEPFIFQNINFKVEPGESVAITGPSGCGKTTLMNILLGVLMQTEGEVIIDGHDVKKLGNGAVRSCISTVLQDDALFAGSLSDNITFFDPNADLVWMKECAMIAAISEEINAMPMGFNTLVGDMGTVLSGGQKQRVFLARALYKRPQILFMDEATSSLDIVKERQVNSAIKKLSITRIIVAHRPETIASADRVIRIENGSATEIIRQDSGSQYISMGS